MMETKTRLKKIYFIAIGLILICSGLLFYKWQRAQAINIQFETENIKLFSKNY
jgi:hypothetical protein